MTDPATVALEIRSKIWPILAGYPPEVQGAALADLLATWLAGHMVMDERIDRPHATRTRKLREGMLRNHIEAVRELIPINEREILENREEDATP